MRGQDRKLLPDGPHLRLGGLATRQERMTRFPDHVRQGGRAYHQRLPAAPPRLVEERHQRPEVACAPERTRGKNTHPPRISKQALGCWYGLAKRSIQV